MATKMDSKQLVDAAKQIAKAHDGGDPPSTILALLMPLENWTATEDALRATRLGVVVGKLRVSSDRNVVLKAGQLINKWKQDVRKQRPSTPGSPATKSVVNGVAAANGRSGTSSPAPVTKSSSSAPPSKKFKADPEKRNSKEDGIDTAVTGNSTRDACVKLMYDGIAFLSEEAPDDILLAAKRVEKAAFDAYKPDASAAYKAKIRSLYQNLKMRPNMRLRQDVYSGKIAPEKFVKLTSEELRSEEQRQKDEALAKENMNKAMTAQEEKAISTTMTCGKCRQNKVAYTQAQTRAADEPMTTFCECTNCGNRWKFS